MRQPFKRWLGRAASAMAAAGVMVFLGMVLGGCNHQQIFGGLQSTMITDGPVARRQYEIFMVTFYVTAAIFVVVGGALVYAVLRFRTKAQPGAAEELPAQIHGNTVIELGLAMVSCMLLVIIAIPTVEGIFYTAAAPENTDKAPVNLVVTGHQWWWQFDYPDLGVVVANELHVPQGHPIPIELHSADVIHSFWVPKLAGKVDVIPGQHNRMWLQGDTIGEFYGQCAEFCGDSHGLMRFRVFVDSEADFDKWVQAQKADVNPQAAQVAADGAALAEERCAICHTIRGTNLNGAVGPDLTHVGSRTTIGAALLENNADNLTKWLHDLASSTSEHPQNLKPGAKMEKNLGGPTLTDDEIKKIVPYLQNLK